MLIIVFCFLYFSFLILRDLLFFAPLSLCVIFLLLFFWFSCARASLSTAAESEDWLTRPRTFAVAQFALFCVCVSLSRFLCVCVRTESGESQLGKESARNECV